MKAVSGSVMRELDRRTIEAGIKNGSVLMETAGVLAAKEIIAFLDSISTDDSAPIVILAGRGNNGGDAFVIARYFSEHCPECTIRMHCVCGENELTGDALEMFRELPQPIRQNLKYTLTGNDLSGAKVIIDALLGTGIKGTLREPFKTWIHLINESQRPTVAIDIPSGLDADNGTITDEAVTADLTVTMALPKAGFLSGDGIKKTGRIRVADIGIPQEYINSIQEFTETQDITDIRALFRREEFDTYKNVRGNALIVGGSKNYPSAPFLSAEAALRSGAGLVTVAIPASLEIVCAVPKSVIVRRIPDDGKGVFTDSSVMEIMDLVVGANALAIGPGMDRSPDSVPFLKSLLSIPVKKVIDADALNLCSANPELLKLLNKDCVLTPHEGEMRRLLNALNLEIPESSIEKARLLSRQTKTISLLKGPRTIIAAPDGKYTVNLSGCAAMGTAGSGDVLTGIISALLANGLPPFDATRGAVFLHGLAGETAMPCGSRGLIADDIPDFIPAALKIISEVS